ncbi:MAG: DegV family protein [Lachnospiraceae bacterium]|nr:DegV family protein [Lachnospiraceae bacterium]
MSFVISTDSGSNMPIELIKENNLVVIPLTYRYDDMDHTTVDLSQFDGDAFYEMIKTKDVTTSTVNLQQFIDAWEPYLEQGIDILHISMSSGISSTYQSSNMAADMIKEDYPDRKIITVDTYAASLAEALNVLDACKYKEEGLTIEEAANKLEKRKSSMRQIFTVDDLMFLKKGGRLSTASAIIGTMLSIKPILVGNEIGQIVLETKERGRKAALKAVLADYVKNVADPAKDIIGIAHSACIKDVQWLIDEIHKINPMQKVITEIYEPVTGSHVGPQTLALFYWKKEPAMA